MNDELNLVKILTTLGKGTKLWSPLLGEVEFAHIRDHETHPIAIITKDGTYYFLTKDGKYFDLEDGECIIFPSKLDRTWENLKNGFKTFDDLKFKIINYNPRIIKAKAITYEAIEEFHDEFTIMVILGGEDMSSNGIDTYDVFVITKSSGAVDNYPFQNKEQINNIMLKLQEMK